MSAANPRSQRRATPPDRASEIQRLTEEMEDLDSVTEGHFNALGMLITDASLAADEPALRTANRRLQWLHRIYDRLTGPGSEQIEHRGRVLGLIDVTHWALRRLPTALGLKQQPTGHAARFLRTVAAKPGLSNREVAAELDVDETEVSRLGRRLTAAGVVWRRKDWRTNAWDVTPRGRHYLDSLPAEAKAPVRAPELVGARPEYAVGVKVLADELVGAVTDTTGAIITEGHRPLPAPLLRDGIVPPVSDFVTQLIEASPAAVKSAPRERIGLGVGMSGDVPAGREPGTERPSEVLHNSDLTDRLCAATGLTTVVGRDVNALAQAVLSFGSQPLSGNLATVVVDPRLDGGLAVDGQIVHDERTSDEHGSRASVSTLLARSKEPVVIYAGPYSPRASARAAAAMALVGSRRSRARNSR